MTEPATAITDYILAAASLVFGIALTRNLLRGGSIPARLWALAFLTAAAAAAAGGTFHGFRLHFDEPDLRALWNATVGLIGLSGGFIFSAVVAGAGMRSREATRWLRAGGLATLGGLVIQQAKLAPHPDFNHNDLYHCIQTVAMYLFYRSAKAVHNVGQKPSNGASTPLPPSAALPLKGGVNASQARPFLPLRGGEPPKAAGGQNPTPPSPEPW